MRKLLVLIPLVAAALFAAGCEDDNNVLVNREPAAPQGVYTVTGDGQVTVWWNGPYERNIVEYGVYRSLESTTGYTEIARVDAVDNPNLDLLIYSYVDDNVINGQTYYYAVRSISSGGYQSDLSAEDAYDTPRPDGSVTLFPMQIDSTLAGFNFEAAARVNYSSALADIFIDIFDGIVYINAANINTDIQDMGYTETFDDISLAPEFGWSELGYLEVITGHTYIVWTADNHYAKVRVQAINPSGSIVLQWGYQTATGNPELIAPLDLERPAHGDNYLKKQSTSTRNAE
ncbi:MAG: fibronectin type III domain-containing protein [candidate division Zixibacteria bacterium]|nr:fibronectin type III domain-containing protein [candidate division Zixibacteria bacterium]